MPKLGFFEGLLRAFRGEATPEFVELLRRRLAIDSLVKAGRKVEEAAVREAMMSISDEAVEQLSREILPRSAWGLVANRAMTGAAIGAAWGGLNSFAEGGSLLRGALGGATTGAIFGAGTGFYSVSGRYRANSLVSEEMLDDALRTSRSVAGTGIGDTNPSMSMVDGVRRVAQELAAGPVPVATRPSYHVPPDW